MFGLVMGGRTTDNHAGMCNAMDIGQRQEESALTNKDIGENLEEVLSG
jgi:hypothetical protein